MGAVPRRKGTVAVDCSRPSTAAPGEAQREACNLGLTVDSDKKSIFHNWEERHKGGNALETPGSPRCGNLGRWEQRCNEPTKEKERAREIETWNRSAPTTGGLTRLCKGSLG